MLSRKGLPPRSTARYLQDVMAADFLAGLLARTLYSRPSPASVPDSSSTARGPDDEVHRVSGAGNAPSGLVIHSRLKTDFGAQRLYGLGGTALTNLTKAFLAAGKHVQLVTLAPELEHGESVILEGPHLRILIGPSDLVRGTTAQTRSERKDVTFDACLFSTSGSVVNAHWTYEFALGATRLPSRVTVVTAHDAPFTVLRHLRPRTYRALPGRNGHSCSTAVPRPSPHVSLSRSDLAKADVSTEGTYRSWVTSCPSR